MGFGAELMSEGACQLTENYKWFSEWGIIVVGNNDAISRHDIFTDVAVGIVRRKKSLCVSDNRQKPAHAASALERTIQIQSPDIVGNIC